MNVQEDSLFSDGASAAPAASSSRAGESASTRSRTEEKRRGETQTGRPSMGAPNKRSPRSSRPNGQGSTSATSPPVDQPPDPPPEQAESVAPAGQGPTQTERIASRDALSREAITDALAGLLRNRASSAPLSIALFGEWGSGKSSQINFLKQKLARTAGKPAIRIIEFNAWEHEKCDNLGAALAQCVVDHLVADTSLWQQWKLARKLAASKRAHITIAARKDWRGLVPVVQRWGAPFMSLELLLIAAVALVLALSEMRGVTTTLVSAGALLLGAWKALNKYVSVNLTSWYGKIASGARGGPFGLPDFSEKLGSFHDIRQTLHRLVAQSVAADADAAEGEYLLIVVDDLDRCGVATIKLMLDAVRLVTSMPRVVTMVALDDRIAFPAVESFFEQFTGTGRDASAVARDYLAKVFNVSISLQPVSAAQAQLFITGRLFVDEDNNSDASERGDEVEVPPVPPPMSRQTIPAVEVKEFARLAGQAGISNPRSLWRMKQVWYLLRTMALAVGSEDRALPDWMRSMFVREAVLGLDAASRGQVEAWAAGAGAAAQLAALLPQALSPGLADLLREDVDGIVSRWSLVDVVLLPAAGPG